MLFAEEIFLLPMLELICLICHFITLTSLTLISHQPQITSFLDLILNIWTWLLAIICTMLNATAANQRLNSFSLQETLVGMDGLEDAVISNAQDQTMFWSMIGLEHFSMLTTQFNLFLTILESLTGQLNAQKSINGTDIIVPVLIWLFWSSKVLHLTTF